MHGMRRVYVPLSEKSISALVALAARRQRSPQRQAALILERYLMRRGLIDDPTAAGKLRTKENADGASNLAGRGAVGQ